MQSYNHVPPYPYNHARTSIPIQPRPQAAYFVYDGWNAAESAAGAAHDSTRRFFSLNRAFTPGVQV